MPKFRITGPDGATYEVTAPDGATEQDVLSYVQQNAGGAAQPAAQPQIEPPVAQQAAAPSPAERDAARKAGTRGVMGAQLPEGLTPQQAQENLGKVGRTAGDIALSAGSGATFGLSDEMLAGAQAGIGGFQPGAYDEALKAWRQRYAEIPPAVRMAGELAGGVATGTGLARGGLTLLNAARPTVAGSALRGAGEGAAYGAAHGFGRGEGTQDRLEGAAYGAALGAPTGAVMGGTGAALAGPRAPKAPTTDELKTAATAAYKQAEQAGVVIGRHAYGDLVNNIRATVHKAGIDKDLHPAASAALNRLVEAKGTQHTLEELEILRRVLGSAAKSKVPDENRITNIMIDKLDDFVDQLNPANLSLIRGDKKGVAALTQARSLWSRMRKGEVVEDLIERAQTSAPNFSGSGYENALRTEFRSLAKNRSKMRGFTEAEQEAIRRVAKGGPLENTLRMLGKFAPTGVVSSVLSGGAGYGVGGPIGMAVLPAAGFAARQGATALTARNARQAGELMRSGGQLPALGRMSPQDQAILRALMIGQAQQTPELRQQLPPLFNMAR